MPITTLPRSASLEMLRKYRPDLADSDPSLAAIATELGDLPLALHLAGSFLARYAGSPHGQPAAYFQALRQKDLLQHPSLRGGLQQRNPTRHEEDVARTFALSYEQLDAADIIDELALSFLVRAAWSNWCGKRPGLSLLVEYMGLATKSTFPTLPVCLDRARPSRLTVKRTTSPGT